jgi:hypothetical protein
MQDMASLDEVQRAIAIALGGITLHAKLPASASPSVVSKAVKAVKAVKAANAAKAVRALRVEQDKQVAEPGGSRPLATRLAGRAIRLPRRMRRLVNLRHVSAAATKRAFRLARAVVFGTYRVCLIPYRSTYRRRLDKVMDRNELPEVLNRRGLLGTAAEIGVKKGNYSEVLLGKWKGRQLISIDPWLEDEPDKYVDRANVAQASHEKFFLYTRERLSKYGSRSTIWRMTSVEAAQQVEDQSLDFVYIDARHDYDSVKEDLHAWFTKVKPGGILAGHDYADGHLVQGVFGVKRAVDEFFGERNLQVNLTRGRWPIEMFPSWFVEIPARTSYGAPVMAAHEPAERVGVGS